MVGGVRCYTTGDDTWYGGRLTAANGYRNGRVGSGLVRFAVETVKSRGCKSFSLTFSLRTSIFSKGSTGSPSASRSFTKG